MPSGGCGNFLWAGAAMNLLISINTVSIVKSLFQLLMLGNFVRSTFPLLGFTHGMLTLETNVTSGGESG